MPIFSHDTLEALTVEQLKMICTKYNINRLPKLKVDIVNKIANVSQLLNAEVSAVDKVLKDIQSKWQADPAPIHNFYKAHFNMDDLNDRKWYAVEECHLNHNWKSKMIIAILRFIV